jgi:tRNA 2-thiouridine synthesizing protein E
MSAPSKEQATHSDRCVRLMAGRKVAFDAEGFFEDFEDWSVEVFEILAGESGISPITDQHRQVVHFLREFYAINGRSPLNNQLRKATGMSLLELDGLFPEGLRQGARRLSGLPNPKSCS